MSLLSNLSSSAGGAKGFINRPPESKSSRNAGYRKTRNFSPFRQAPSFSAKRNQMIVPPVSGLFRLSSPSAIFRTVWAVVINTVNRVFFGRTLSHVFQKMSKIFPPFTNGYASRSVFVIGGMVGVLATTSHRVPTFIHGVIGKAMFYLLSVNVHHGCHYNIGEGH